jgi:hypothetical protein
MFDRVQAPPVRHAFDLANAAILEAISDRDLKSLIPLKTRTSPACLLTKAAAKGLLNCRGKSDLGPPRWLLIGI